MEKHSSLISNNVSLLLSGGGTSSSSTTSPSTRLPARRRQSKPAEQNCDTCRSTRQTSTQSNWCSIPSRRCYAKQPSAQSTGWSDAFAPSFEDSNLPNAQAISGTAAMIHYDRDLLIAPRQLHALTAIATLSIRKPHVNTHTKLHFKRIFDALPFQCGLFAKMWKLIELVQIPDGALLQSVAHDRFRMRLPNAGNLAKFRRVRPVDVYPFRLLFTRRWSIIGRRNGQLLLHLFKFLRWHITD